MKNRHIIFGLLEKVINIATCCFDGHFTLMKFTRGYKLFFGTPIMLDHQWQELEDDFPTNLSLKEALFFAIQNKKELALARMSRKIKEDDSKARRQQYAELASDESHKRVEQLTCVCCGTKASTTISLFKNTIEL